MQLDYKCNSKQTPLKSERQNAQQMSFASHYDTAGECQRFII